MLSQTFRNHCDFLESVQHGCNTFVTRKNARASSLRYVLEGRHCKRIKMLAGRGGQRHPLLHWTALPGWVPLCRARNSQRSRVICARKFENHNLEMLRDKCFAVDFQAGFAKHLTDRHALGCLKIGDQFLVFFQRICHGSSLLRLPSGFRFLPNLE
jgi:hypothetical protein